MIIRELERKGIVAFIYHGALTGSVYVKFGDSRLRSLRIGDHDGRSKYKYKWNLRSDIASSGEIMDHGVRRFFCRWDEWGKLIDRIKGYHDAILDNNLWGFDD